MRAVLDSGALIDLWDRGLDAAPVDRAVEALVAGLGLDRADVEVLPPGRRDALLFDLRARLSGERFDAVTTCPSCGETVEVGFTIDDVTNDAPAGAGAVTETGDWVVAWRLPDAVDLRAIAGLFDLDRARAELAARCIVEAIRAGEPAAELPDTVLERVVDDMGRADPGAEIRFELVCPWCERSWTDLFDIGEFLWSEIDAAAGRSLEEVGALAAAFGWSERDILGLAPARRARYLELVT